MTFSKIKPARPSPEKRRMAAAILHEEAERLHKFLGGAEMEPSQRELFERQEVAWREVADWVWPR